MSAPYDVVLYGATGFTGRIVAQYLAEHPQQPSIAFAGRNKAKVQSIIDGLTNVSADRVKSIGVIEASAGNFASLQALAKSARVIINTVGPYSKLGGFDVVRAAIEAGVGYVDLTGETSYYARVARELHDEAVANKAVIIPSAGFDSLPFDLTTYLANEEIRRADPNATIAKTLLAYKVKGGVSGGTIASAISMREEADQGALTKPYWLSPVTGSSKYAVGPIKMPQENKYGIPSPFTPHNARIVYRTWGLLYELDPSRSYGPTFTYEEGVTMPNLIYAYIINAVMSVFMWLLINVGIVAHLVSKAIPPGSGPSLEKQLNGKVHLRAYSEAHNSKLKAIAEFSANGDPGYMMTSRFLAETALALAFDRERLSPLAQTGGVLTPATVGGAVIASRLGTYAGVTIKSAVVNEGADLTRPL